MVFIGLRSSAGFIAFIGLRSSVAFIFSSPSYPSWPFIAFIAFIAFMASWGLEPSTDSTMQAALFIILARPCINCEPSMALT